MLTSTKDGAVKEIVNFEFAKEWKATKYSLMTLFIVLDLAWTYQACWYFPIYIYIYLCLIILGTECTIGEKDYSEVYLVSCSLHQENYWSWRHNHILNTASLNWWFLIGVILCNVLPIKINNHLHGTFRFYIWVIWIKYMIIELVLRIFSESSSMLLFFISCLPFLLVIFMNKFNFGQRAFSVHVPWLYVPMDNKNSLNDLFNLLVQDSYMWGLQVKNLCEVINLASLNMRDVIHISKSCESECASEQTHQKFFEYK